MCFSSFFHRFFLQVDKNTKIFKKFFEKLIFNKKYVFIKVFEKKQVFVHLCDFLKKGGFLCGFSEDSG